MPNIKARVLELAKLSWSTSAIAQETGLSKCAVRKIRRRFGLGVQENYKRYWEPTPEEIERGKEEIFQRHLAEKASGHGYPMTERIVRVIHTPAVHRRGSSSLRHDE
jgi:hypothetical protein